MKNSKFTFIFCLLTNLLVFTGLMAQEESLPVQYEELTAPEFVKAVAQSEKTCIIPIGILEKHGPHLPLSTDLIIAREIAIRAAKIEYTVVFPAYYFGQIFEAKHQPGAIAYSHELMWNMLEETCNELSRNGFKKIILVNGHGGNPNFLNFFCQSQLEKKRDYAVLFFNEEEDPEITKKVDALRKTKGVGHADELEASMILATRPDLAHLKKGKDESGDDMKRLTDIKNMYTAIWWYARFPNHYAGDGSVANKEIGDLLINSYVNQLVSLLKKVKKDSTILELQNEFFKKAENPLQIK